MMRAAVLLLHCCAAATALQRPSSASRRSAPAPSSGLSATEAPVDLFMGVPGIERGARERLTFASRFSEPLLSPRVGDLGRLSPNTLAYVGDGVLELFWRSRTLWPAKKLVEQQKTVSTAAARLDRHLFLPCVGRRRGARRGAGGGPRAAGRGRRGFRAL